MLFDVVSVSGRIAFVVDVPHRHIGVDVVTGGLLALRHHFRPLAGGAFHATISLPSPAAAVLSVKHAVSTSSTVGYSVGVDGGNNSIALVETGGGLLARRHHAR